MYSDGRVVIGQENSIIKLTFPDYSTTFVGGINGLFGFADGDVTASRFNNIGQIAFGDMAQTFIFVCDTSNNAIRQVDVENQITTTSFSISSPVGIVVDTIFANVYVSLGGSQARIFVVTISSWVIKSVFGVADSQGNI